MLVYKEMTKWQVSELGGISGSYPTLRGERHFLSYYKSKLQAFRIVKAL